MAHAHLKSALLLFVAACSPAPEAKSPPPSAGPTPAVTAASQPKPEPLADAQWKQVASRFQSLEVPLPMASEWQVLDGKHELRAIHRPTDSELSARLWRASRLVSRDECEKQLHLWRPDLPNPSEAPETVLDSRDITAPAGFSVTVTAGVRRTDTSLEGYLLAIGVAVGQCYAASFVTHAVGPGAETAIGDRLAVVGERVLPRVQRVGVEGRIY
ncbi:MAG: hypothetical protein KC776_00960 [Myxococcales bacterium]|nr:hypothetical protein [Myxococcales bacterium]MCB9582707.1 hypothetical protein [Polyangiaceae bacterium]